jgi:LysR family transcriptional regulator, glycine cleavage system transcriptional activator
MGPTALVSGDLEQGRLVASFPGPALPARSYRTYVRDAKERDDVAVAFRSWLERVGNMSKGKREKPASRKLQGTRQPSR